MGYVRLTNDMRDATVERLMVHRFKDEIEALIKRQADFARRVYDDVFSAAMQSKMNALPKGWLPEDDDLTVQFGESRGTVELDLDGYNLTREMRDASGCGYAPKDITRRRFLTSQHQGTLKVYDALHPLALERDEISASSAALNQRVKDAHQQARSALYSVTTVGALINNWPEAKPFVQRYIDEPPAMLPALPVAKLNAVFDLPADEVPAQTAIGTSVNV